MDSDYLTVDHLSLIEITRIFARISIDPSISWNGTPCWVWTGARRPKWPHGYVNWKRGIYYAHRFIYAWLIAPLPKRRIGDWTLDHLCRNQPCCNPVHLELVPGRINTLRGIGLSAINAKKTHCKRGHPLSGSNLYISKKGHRVERICRECKNQCKRDHRTARKIALSDAR